MRKMYSASYALRQVKYTLSIDSLKIIYFAHMHSITSYGVIFWGNSPSAKKVFKLQKKIIRIISNIGMRDSYRENFINLKIITLYSLYAYSVILFVVIISIYLLLIMKYMNTILEIIKIFTQSHYVY
jgi:hypothetical protein